MSIEVQVGALSLFALVASVAGCERSPDEVTSRGVRVVPARTISVPTTVSPELQKVIAKPIGYVPVARTADEWRAARPDIDETVSGDAATYEAVLVAQAARTVVLSVDYRMAPDHPFPAALDDAVAAWKAVLASHDPRRMALFGTSAGGGLTMATVMRLRDLGLPLPAALYLGTPWTDLAKRGDTYFTLAGVDNELDTYNGGLESAAGLYAGDRALTDPFISPVYGDLRGFPPAILISGTRDLLLSCTVRAHRALRQVGVEADLHVFEGQSHAQHAIAHKSPESKEAMNEIAAFFDRHLQR